MPMSGNTSRGVSVLVSVVLATKLFLGKNTFNPPSSFKKERPSVGARVNRQQHMHSSVTNNRLLLHYMLCTYGISIMKCVVTNSLTAGQAEGSTEKGGKPHFFFSFDIHQQQWMGSGKRRHASVYLTSARYPAPPVTWQLRVCCHQCGLYFCKLLSWCPHRHEDDMQAA